MTNLCPACESGTLAARVGDKIIQFEGAPLRVPNLHYSECSVCFEKLVLPAQSKRNEVAYADAKKSKLGLWSCGKIEAFRKKWDLTQAAASKILGGGANAFSKYERGEVLHSKSMDLLMRMFDEVEEVRLQLSEKADVILSTSPDWETIKVGPAPRRRVSVQEFLPTLRALKHPAANGDHWQTCELAYGN